MGWSIMPRADENICLMCDWSESGSNANPNRMECPECGAPFHNRYTQRVFVEPDLEKTHGK